MGSCLTDATPEGRSRRVAREWAARPPPERVQRRSSRLLWRWFHASPLSSGSRPVVECLAALLPYSGKQSAASLGRYSRLSSLHPRPLDSILLAGSATADVAGGMGSEATLPR